MMQSDDPSDESSGDSSDDISIEDLFELAEQDGETVVPIPVFASGVKSPGQKINGPKYCPFGLGYRRCPGEILNNFILGKILSELGDLEFEANVDLFADPPSDNFVNAALSRLPDAIFLKTEP